MFSVLKKNVVKIETKFKIIPDRFDFLIEDQAAIQGFQERLDKVFFWFI